jgi:hypothetical protein
VIKEYVVDETVIKIAYPPDFNPQDLTDEMVREVLRRAKRHSNLTWLRDVLYDERIREKDRIVALVGEHASQIRFNNPNAFLSFADTEVDWDLNLAFAEVKGLSALKSELTWLQVSAQVSFSAANTKEYQAKMAKLKQFMKSLDGSVDRDSIGFVKRYAEQTIRNFCRATKQAFPWAARHVVVKTARWFDKLPGSRLRLRKRSANAPGQ